MIKSFLILCTDVLCKLYSRHVSVKTIKTHRKCSKCRADRRDRVAIRAARRWFMALADYASRTPLSVCAIPASTAQVQTSAAMTQGGSASGWQCWYPVQYASAGSLPVRLTTSSRSRAAAHTMQAICRRSASAATALRPPPMTAASDIHENTGFQA